jgi:hypothetical protein
LLNTTLLDFFEQNEFPGRDFKFFIYLHSFVPKAIFRNKLLNKFYTTFLLHTNYNLSKTLHQLIHHFETTGKNLLLLQLIQELKEKPLIQNKPEVLQYFINKETQLEKRLFSAHAVVDLTQDEEETNNEDLQDQNVEYVLENETEYSSLPSPPSLSSEESNEVVDLTPYTPLRAAEEPKETTEPFVTSTQMAQMQQMTQLKTLTEAEQAQSRQLEQENEELRKQLFQLREKYNTKQKLLMKLGQKGLLFRSNYNLRHKKTTPFKPPKTIK